MKNTCAHLTRLDRADLGGDAHRGDVLPSHEGDLVCSRERGVAGESEHVCSGTAGQLTPTREDGSAPQLPPLPLPLNAHRMIMTRMAAAMPLLTTAPFTLGTWVANRMAVAIWRAEGGRAGAACERRGG